MLPTPRGTGGKQDEVCIVLFGTEESSSWENGEDGSCQHVKLFQELQVATLDGFKELGAVASEAFASDPADALAVACGTLDRLTGKKKYARRVLLVTDAAGGAAAQLARLDAVAVDLAAVSVAVELVIVDGAESTPRAKAKTDAKRKPVWPGIAALQHL